MRFYYLIIIFLLIQLSPLYATTNFYIEITKTEIEVGRYTDNKYKKRPIKSYKKEAIDMKDIKEIFDDKAKGKRVLFYFHSMWGSVQPYHNNSLKKINQSLKVDQIITVEWHADGLKYKKSWEQSIHQGAQISKLFEQLINNKHNEYFVLCHSMGHRIFEGVIKEIPASNHPIKAIFFAAADLDIDVFETNLKQLTTTCDQIIIYIHEKDRLLKVSKKIHKKERLGLHASKHRASFTAIANLEIVNVTTSLEKKQRALSHHIYFKTNKSVLRDIALVIEENIEKRKSYHKKVVDNYIELK